MLRIAGVCICLLAAADSNAQTLSPDLATAVEKQAVVRITDDTGREFDGRLLRADDKIFTVKTPDGEIPFSFQRISTIYRRGDSLRNGLIVGLAIGSVTGVLASLGSGNCDELSSTDLQCSSKAGVFARAVASWTVIGVGIDALRRGWTRIYPPRHQAPAAPSQP